MQHRRTFVASALAMAAAAALPKSALAAQARPFKLYDTHTHFYTSDLAKYPYRPDVAAAAKTRTLAQPITPEYLFKLWDDNGVEMGCGVQYNTVYFTDNRYVLDVSAQYPKRIVPIVILPPSDPATPATLARMVKENHIAGVRFFSVPDAAGNMEIMSDAAKGVWEAANALGLVIVLIMNPTDQPQALPAALERLAAFADRYPNVNIVLDHLAFPPGSKFTENFGFSPQKLALAQHKNIYYKYSTFLIEMLRPANVQAKAFLEYAVGALGANQFVWGSDIGNTPGNYAEFVKAALDSASGLPMAAQKAMFYDTAKRVFIPGGRGHH